MESVFLINPKRKRRRKGRMPAGLARYWAKHRRGGKKRRRVSAKARMENPRRRRRRNPRRRRARARRRNPVYRHKRRRVSARRRRSNPRRHRHYARRRRNPFGGGEISNVIMPALIGAGGALVVSVGYGYLSPYLPSSLTTGFIPSLVQAAVAVGAGFLAGKAIGRQKGNAVAVGALTVIAVNALTPYISSATGGSVPGISGFGGLKLGGVGDYVPYRKPIGAYMRPGMGRLGAATFTSPAPRVGAYMAKNRAGMRGYVGFQRPGVGAYLNRAVPGMGRMSGAVTNPDFSGGSGYTGLNDGM
jgi:hypothetical protein